MYKRQGEVLAKSFVRYFADKNNQEQLKNLDDLLIVSYPEKKEHQPFAGLTFVITGTLNTFDNRNQCKDMIESLGGKVAGSVSKNTSYLVNNDITSPVSYTHLDVYKRQHYDKTKFYGTID